MPPRRVTARDAPVRALPPPIAGGTDVVAAWAQQLGLDLAREPAGERSRLARGALDALGRCRGAARDSEALLAALAQRGEAAEGADGPEAPADEVALVLWQWFEVARLTWACATGPLEVAREAAAQVRQLAANVRARPTARAEDVRRRLRLPRDAREAVLEHEAVSAKLADEALDADDAAAARRGLVDFGLWMQRGFLAPPHVRLIADALERVERGECLRLIVEVPPRHGKSSLVSHLFPAWYLGRHPDRDVICATHSQEMADNFGRAVRNSVGGDEFARVFPGVHLAGDSQAAARFNLETDEEWRGPGGEAGGTRMRRGVYKSYGRTGRYTGSGANLLLCDDLIAEHEADSDAAKREAHRAIQALRSRLAPKSEGAAWVIINTRYREDDPIGYVLSEYAADGPWEVIRFPALAEEDEEHVLPDGSTWRRGPGDALWPERYTRAELEALRATLLRTSPQDWHGQYMCRPVPAAGAMVNVGWFRRYGGGPDAATAEQPAGTGAATPTAEQVREWAARVVVSVDTSKGTGAGAARTAIGVWCELHGRGRVDGAYLREVLADPIGFEVQLDRVKEVCRRWLPHALLIEDKSTGEALIPMLRSARDWPGTPIYAVSPTADKAARMATCTPSIRDGQVWVPARGSEWASWLPDFERELTFFPVGKLKDVADMVSQYLNWRRENPLSLALASGTPSQDVQRALGGAWHGAGGGASSSGTRRLLGGQTGGRRRGW